MADEANQFREEAAAALERRDSRAANEAYQRELEALSRPKAAPTDDKDSDTGADAGDGLAGADDYADLDDHTDEQIDYSPEAVPAEFDKLEAVPVPSHLTSAIYEDFAAKFGDEEAASLERAWGNHAVENERLARCFLEDTPEAARIYEAHAAEDGSLTPHGIQAALALVMKQTGAKSPEDLDRQHPELAALWHEHFSEHNYTLSPTGVLRMLHYLASTSGYRYKFHGGRRK